MTGLLKSFKSRKRSSSALFLGAAHSQTRRRLFSDRWARRFVTLGGMLVIGSILAILLVILAEVYPLFRSPRVRPERGAPGGPGGAPLALKVDEYREIACLIVPEGLRFISLKDGRPLLVEQPRELARLEEGGASVQAVSDAAARTFALALSDGSVLPVEVAFDTVYRDGGRVNVPRVAVRAPLSLAAASSQAAPASLPAQAAQAAPVPLSSAVPAAAVAVTAAASEAPRRIAYVEADGGTLLAASGPTSELTVIRIKQSRALVGEPATSELRSVFSLPGGGEISAQTVDSRGEVVALGTSTGEVLLLDVIGEGAPAVIAQTRVGARPDVKIGALSFLLGDRTLAVGDAEGRVSTWQVLPAEEGRRQLLRVHEFQGHRGPVAAITPSRRDKGFLTADAGGTVHLHYATTGKTLLSIAGGGSAGKNDAAGNDRKGKGPNGSSTELRALDFAPKADGILTAHASREISHWSLENPHPEVSLQALFGKVTYEGYGTPEYVWQSTGGTDDFEPKLSLTPLLYGTLKGTFYALLFAVPLALLGALYASQFLHPGWRSWLKPTVEIMAALPSVVLGFIAGLWLAPKIESVVPGLFVLPWVLSALVIAACLGWRALPGRLRRVFPTGSEILLLLPVIVLGGWLSFLLGDVFEHTLLQGDYRHWLLEALGLTYDQRNSLVVGFAMGFAVVPIIFTIAEDSLSNVPRHLVAGSLALGATRWQTALRVVLPTGSPGIFSAIMIGFGRAVGETMIVLMATGNTPVMDWSIFNGFRALSANIAVELPEAPHGGTLYRVLFLAALLLFAMTFLVNTAAELVRLRLRKRYRVL